VFPTYCGGDFDKKWNCDKSDQNFELLKLYGEVDELFQAHLHHDQDNFKEECADVAIYLLGIAEIGDADLGEVISEKDDFECVTKIC